MFLLISFVGVSINYSEYQIAEGLSNGSSLKYEDKIYENTGNNFKIAYPFGWREISNGSNVTLVSPLEDKSDDFQEKIIFTFESTGNIKLVNMVSLKIIGYRQDLIGFNLLDFRKDILGGNPAHLLVYSYNNDNMSLTNLELFTSVGTKTYSFYFVSETSKFSSYLPIIHKLLNSIEIQGLTTSPTKPVGKVSELEISVDPYSMVVDPVTGKMYITNIRFHTVSVVDSSTDKILKEINVGRYPTSIGIDTGVNNIFVTNSRSNTVSVIDVSTDEVIKTLETGNEPDALIVDDSEKGLDSIVFVANSHSNSISVIDGDKVEVMNEEIKLKDLPSGLALNKISNSLYITHKDSNSISVIDYFLSKDSSFHYNNVTTVRVGKYPTGINVNLDSNQIYVANSHDNSVSIINGSSNKVEKMVPVGIEPADVEINSNTNIVYVTNYQNNTVSIINGTNGHLIKDLQVGRYPDAIYLNPTNEIVYVINLGSNTISQIRDKSLLSGITFNIDPQNSGHLYCNEKQILGKDYIRYAYDSRIECTALPNPEFKFKTWSADLKLNSESNPQTTFNSTGYGNITAYFDTAVELTLPEGYWDQVRLAVASVVIPALIGWLIPSIASFINSTRQRKSMRKTMQEIIVLQKNQMRYDSTLFTKRLSEIQDEIIGALTSGKISETQYDILNGKIDSLRNQK
jgi:YVTN family beta-propeller protein